MKKRKDRSREEMLAFLKWRQEHPLYVDSVEIEGVTLSFVNPELIENGKRVGDSLKDDSDDSDKK